MTITITAYDRSPDGGAGLARDMRVRWALEEVGVSEYDVRGVSLQSKFAQPYLSVNPFGLIPSYEEGTLTLFESGSIVLRIAEQHGGLLPAEPDARARAITWMFAAVATVDPPIMEIVTAKFVEGDKPWASERMTLVLERVRTRVSQLADHLEEREWLEDAFTAGDLMMVHVLLRLRPSGVLDEFPNLAAYVARGEARPAFQRAFAAQRDYNNRAAPSA